MWRAVVCCGGEHKLLACMGRRVGGHADAQGEGVLLFVVG